jgi:5-(carboxyamino)imidazole ribonucleotide mutase
MEGKLAGGLDALLSTVQMPRGVPVATLAVGKSGAVNAGLLACQILAVADAALRERLEAHKDKMAQDVASSAANAQRDLESLLGR